MRMSLVIAGLLVSIAVLVPPAAAQSEPPAALTPAQIAVACAPPVAPARAEHALQILGAQDTTPRTIFDERDLLVVDGGTDASVRVDAMFYVRHPATTDMAYMAGGRANAATTDGVIRIVAVNASTAIARVEHACGAVFAGDILEPYVPPSASADASTAPFDADFDHLGRVLSGVAGRPIAAVGEFALLETGSDDRLQPGTRVAIYRDLTEFGDPYLRAPHGTPLTAIGEAVVVSTSRRRALARIVSARDAVQSGDYAAPPRR